MSDSREGSPDWLREFQAPTLLTLSSTSDSSPEASPERSVETHQQEPEILSKKQDKVVIDIGEDSPVTKTKKPKTSRTEKKKKEKEDVQAEGPAEEDIGEDSQVVKAKKPKSSRTGKKKEEEDAHEEGPAEEDAREAPAGPSVSSRLPLIFPDKVQRSKALVECDGDAIDLSGDVGAVGRIIISNDPAGNKEMILDLKGNFYKSTIVPSRTFCVVSVGQTEAKIEAIMNDFIQLEPSSNVFEAETMIEGTLDGFSFDSDEDGEKMPKTTVQQTDQNNENGNQTNKRAKRKAETSQGGAKKKAKAVKPKTVRKTKKSKK
ncbi:DNA-binding protein BIN4 [Iris pallida]|uniref:DNA-binding protein BIN4 n=1 Tax=Iris pallida TaxID=29817 RepID=A0AAX6FTL2_IRIPA|nr:DNA-binding protein BIN4 [Iris pallida]